MDRHKRTSSQRNSKKTNGLRESTERLGFHQKRLEARLWDLTFMSTNHSERPWTLLPPAIFSANCNFMPKLLLWLLMALVSHYLCGESKSPMPLFS